MYSAGLLALEGKEVLVLEQHNVLGGLMQSYRRDRLTFPTGVHCIGSLSEGQVLWRYLDYLGVLDRIALAEMDPDGFQEFVFAHKTYTMPTGHDAYRDKLLHYFPNEQSAIDTFMQDMKICMARSPFYQIDPERVFARAPMDSVSLQNYLDGLTSSSELKCLLSASYPLYGIDPTLCPLSTHFSVLDSFLNSSYRVDERAKPLAKSFMFRLRELGVEFRRSSEVEEVVCEGRTLKGVRLSDDECIDSDIVMYSGHPTGLVERCSGLRPAFKWRMAELENTDCFISAGLSWSHPECSVRLRDTFIFNTTDIKKSSLPWRLEAGDTPGVLYVAGVPNAERGRYAVVAVAAANYGDWKDWGTTDTGRRGQKYDELKQQFADNMVRQVRAQWPEAASSIELIDCNSPLTLQNYTQSPLGTGYGIKKTVETLGSSQVGAKTSIKGLYMIGQSSQLPGIVGTVISSVVACSHILGEDYLLGKIARSTR